LEDRKVSEPAVEVDPPPVLAPLAIIAPAIALIITLPFLFVYAAIPAGIALVGAVVVGAPALSTARRFGLRGVVLTTALGAVTAGVAVYSVVLATALIYRSLVQVNPDGLLIGITIGAATGATYATLYDSVNLSPTNVRWRILIIVMLAVTMPWVGMAVRAGR
jgi:hypothetical protein